MYSDTRYDVSKGSYSLDLTKYLMVGTTDVYVYATTTDPITGKTQTNPGVCKRYRRLPCH